MAFDCINHGTFESHSNVRKTSLRFRLSVNMQRDITLLHWTGKLNLMDLRKKISHFLLCSISLKLHSSILVRKWKDITEDGFQLPLWGVIKETDSMDRDKAIQSFRLIYTCLLFGGSVRYFQELDLLYLWAVLTVDSQSNESLLLRLSSGSWRIFVLESRRNLPTRKHCI